MNFPNYSSPRHVKNPMVSEIFNMVGFHIPNNCDTKVTWMIKCKKLNSSVSSIPRSPSSLRSRCTTGGSTARCSTPCTHCRTPTMSQGKDQEDMMKQNAYLNMPREDYLAILLRNLSPQVMNSFWTRLTKLPGRQASGQC